MSDSKSNKICSTAGHRNYYPLEQELCSRSKENAKFPSTTPAAHVINAAGLLSQSHRDLAYPTCYSVQ